MTTPLDPLTLAWAEIGLPVRRGFRRARGRHAPVPGFRPNAPRRRMRTPGGRIVRRVMR